MGGAMLMRKADFDQDKCGVKSRWLDGGYSDDMIVWSCAIESGRAVSTPLCALLPNLVRKDVTLQQAFNFLHRQVFVLTTYASKQHFWQHMLLFLAYGLLNMLQCLALSASALVLVCTLASSPLVDAVAFMNFCSAGLYVAALCCCALVQHMHILDAAGLAAALSPGLLPLPLWHVGPVKLLASSICHSFLAAVLVLLALCRRSITWGGTTYHIHDGKVNSISWPGVDLKLEYQTFFKAGM